jgi:hypothetical protein
VKRKVLLLSACLFLLLGLLPATLSAQSFADSAFESVWTRTDKPLADNRTARSWMWGPQPFTEGIQEPYAESPGGTRLVQYFDKSRMEINDPNADRGSAWFVTNGLLVREMVDGRVQLGDSTFETRSPAQETVAGDSVAVNPNCPTYASFTYLTWTRADSRMGQKVTATLAKDGTVGDDSSKASYSSTEIAYYDETNGHNIPKVLWNMMNQSGLVYVNGRYTTAKVVDWLFAMGYPISEPYWVRSNVAGEEKDVLVQLFERRVLTYTPSNPAGWQVEMGNVGLHYYNWRYGTGGVPAPPPATPGCEGVPADVSGSITPKCGMPGTAFTLSISGFTPNEQIGFWLTDPHGNMVGTVDTVSIGPSGGYDWAPIAISEHSDPGLYYWVFQGVSSGHKAILYFMVHPWPWGATGCGDPETQCPSAVSVWDLVEMKGHDAPGIIEYEFIIPQGAQLLVGSGWCAANDAILQDNISKMQWSLTIDGQSYASSIATQGYWPDGRACVFAGVMIRGWTASHVYTVDWGFTFTQDVNDGWSTYPAGQYLDRFLIHIP